MDKSRLKTLFLLHIMLMIYSMSGICSKLASGVVCFKRLIHHDMSKSLKTYKATKQKGDPHEQTENNRPV